MIRQSKIKEKLVIVLYFIYDFYDFYDFYDCLFIGEEVIKLNFKLKLVDFNILTLNP